MLDQRSRRALTRPLDGVAAALDRPWISPNGITLVGLLLGLSAAFAAGRALWGIALLLWLSRCLADGVDGPLARRRARKSGTLPSASGGYLDICSDFAVYGAFVVGVGIGVGDLLPFMVVLLAYYLNGSVFLAFSSLAEKTGHELNDGRSLSFLGGLAEGTETVIVHCLWCVIPSYAVPIAWAWAGVVGISAVGRVIAGFRILR